MSPPARRAPAPVLAAPAESEQRKEAAANINAKLAEIHKVHGAHVIKAAELRPRFLHIPTGIFTLDMACLGGIPEGVATLNMGWEHSGKTTGTLRTLGRAQKKYRSEGKRAALVDLEGTYAPEWGAFHGIDNSELLLIQPDSGEQALDITVELLKTREICAIAIDSLAGLVPMKEQERSFEDQGMGEQARMIGRFCRVAQNILLQQRRYDHHPALMMINQWRFKIGVMHGDPRVLPGGQAQHYMAALKIDWKNKEIGGKAGDGQEANSIAYNEHSFTIKKNKVGIAAREGVFKMIRDPNHPLGQGFIDDASTVVTYCKSVNWVTGGGSSWKLIDVDQKFSRLQEIADYLYDEPEFYESLKARLITAYRKSRGLDHDWYRRGEY
jgi:recombination protein RecA